MERPYSFREKIYLNSLIFVVYKTPNPFCVSAESEINTLSCNLFHIVIRHPVFHCEERGDAVGLGTCIFINTPTPDLDVVSSDRGNYSYLFYVSLSS